MPKSHGLTFAIIFLLATAIAGSVFAEEHSSFRYQIDVKAGGRIDVTREIGSYCITGAAKRQSIRGEGEYKLHEVVRFAPGGMAIEENIDWYTFEDAIRNLTVTSTIRLCAPGISTAVAAYSGGGYDIAAGDLISPHHPLVRSGDATVSGQSSQIWHVSVAPNPGHTAFIRSDFEAGYSGNIYYDKDDVPEDIEDRSGWYAQSDPNWPGRDVFHYGPYYRGYYFDMVQHLYTSDGTTRRFTDISSPFSNGRVYTSFEVKGVTEAWEELNMKNLPTGRLATPLSWWYLF